MPSIFIPTPQFPTVPKLPGVPQLARPIAALAAVIPGIIQVLQVQSMPAVLFQAVKSDPVWGVFDSSGANLVLNPESMAAFSMRGEWRTSDYTVQDGQFASYDKVTVPREIMVRMLMGKTLQDRLAFEEACETVAASLDVFTIITPERKYSNMNPFRHEVNRVERKGAFFIETEMYFRQINSTSTASTATANTNNATQPPAIPAANLGIVQPASPSNSLAKLVAGALPAIPKIPL